MQVWHVCNEDGSGWKADEQYEIGKEYAVEGEVRLCENGFHGSVKLLDALSYRSSGCIEMREITEDVEEGGDKIVGRKMVTLWRLSKEQTELVLDKFARWYAIQEESQYLDWAEENDPKNYEEWVKKVSPWLRSGEGREDARKDARDAWYAWYARYDWTAWAARVAWAVIWVTRDGQGEYLESLALEMHEKGEIDPRIEV